MNVESESVGDEGRGFTDPPRPSLGVGSFFESSVRDQPSAKRLLPWSNGDGPVYVQSGRQALRLLSELLWSDGYRRLVVPGYLCESMIEPFRTRDWVVRFSPMGDRLRPVAESYEELCLERPGETVALFAEFFGRKLSEAARAVVARLRDRGVVVVEDRTHNLLDAYVSAATYEFGSLRKLLPVGDGCFVRGLQREPQFAAADLDPSESSWRAMDLKSGARNQSDVDFAFGQHKIAEAEFGFASEPAAMSSRTLLQLEGLDFAAMAEARRMNFATLKSLIRDETVVNDDLEGDTPAFLVLRTEQPELLQGALAKRGIYCPIHWPRPRQIPERLLWFDDLISLPIDHRYGREEMQFVAQTLSEVGKRFG